MPLVYACHHQCPEFPLLCARLAFQSRLKPCPRLQHAFLFLMTFTELRFSLTRRIHKLRSEGKVYYISKVSEPTGAVLKLFIGAVESSRPRASRECCLALLWLIVAKFSVLWRSMCADSCACGGCIRAYHVPGARM